MSIPLNASAIGNAFRLAALKNVNGKRRIAGAPEIEEELAPPPIDIQGTEGDIENAMPPPPPPAMSPQSMDVRANQVMPKARQAPEQQEELMANQVIPEVPQEPEQQEGFWSKLGRGLKELYFSPGIGEQFKKPYPELYNAPIETIQKNIKASGIQQQEQEEMNQALQNPYTTIVYGANDKVANQPPLQKTFKMITGMDYTDEIQRQTTEYEKILNDVEKNLNAQFEGYTEQEKRIRERIESNQATDMDKFYVGLALLMPLIVGGFFGAEAGLGALAGGTKGLADIYKGRKEDVKEDEALLADLAKNKAETELKKSELDLKKMSIPQEIKKNLPEDEKAFLKGKKEVTWIDPVTGERRSGIELKPGAAVLPEYAANTEEITQMNKEAEEISKASVPIKEINRLTKEVIDIVSQMQDKGFLGEAFMAHISDKRPDLASKFGEKVNFQGRKVNAYTVLDTRIKGLVDAYRQMKGMKALTETVDKHIQSLFLNPAASFLSYQDSIEQMLFIRDLAQSRLLNTVQSEGFSPEYMADYLKPEYQETYDTLNRQANEKRAEELLR